MVFTPQSLSVPFLEMVDSDFVRRAASSPQLVRVRARSNSASSSASLTATEENYTRLRERSSASSSHFPSTFPTTWPFSQGRQPVLSEHRARHVSDREDASESEEEQIENDDVLFMSRASSSTNVGAGGRSRKSPARRQEGALLRMVTTARGQPCAGETETELDELPARLPTSRIIKSSRPLDFFIHCLFESFQLLSVVPSFFGVVHNLHNVLHPPDTTRIRFARVDYVLCVLWAMLTGLQCLALTTGLLSRWRAYYTTPSTLIRLVALQCICWPATHFTLQFFDYSHRPVACWAIIGTTTCYSRSVQIWVTSNLYMPVSAGDGRVLRPGGRLGPRRWDWVEVTLNCALPVGVMYFITAWFFILKYEMGLCQ